MHVCLVINNKCKVSLENYNIAKTLLIELYKMFREMHMCIQYVIK